MAEEETIFDATLKKKKKKKTGFNLDSSEAILEAAPAIDENVSIAVAESEDVAADVDDIDLLGKKKKKKKSKPYNMDELKESLPENVDEDSTIVADEMTPGGFDELNMDFSKIKKNKKKTKSAGIEDLLSDEKSRDSKNNKDTDGGEGWVDTDRDYTYEELIQRAFSLLKEKNPDMVTGEKKKFVMKPPQVVRIGSKKTAFANFADICRLMHRIPKHLLQFLLAELGTSGSIDGNNQLIIKGRFQQKQIENVLKRYIKEYVTCHTCRSPNTILQKDARIYFLQCEQCNSRCSVTPIKSGFQAVANKQQRQAIRANKN